MVLGRTESLNIIIIIASRLEVSSIYDTIFKGLHVKQHIKQKNLKSSFVKFLVEILKDLRY